MAFRLRIGNSLAAKVTLSLLAVYVPLSLVSLFISYSASIAILDSETRLTEARLIYQGGKNLENYFQSLDTLLLSAYREPSFLDNLPPAAGDFPQTTRNEHFLNGLLFAADEIQYVYLYTKKDGRLYSLSKQMQAYSDLPEAPQVDWITSAEASADAFSLGKPGPFVNLRKIGTAGSDRVFMASRRLFDIPSGTTLGVLALAVSTAKVEQITENMRSGQEDVAIFRRGAGRIWGPVEIPSSLLDTVWGDAGKIVQNVVLAGENRLVTLMSLAHGYVVVKTVPVSAIHQSAWWSLLVGLAVLGMVLLGSLGLLLFLGARIVAPLTRLAEGLVQVQANAFAAIPNSLRPTERTDEIGALHNGFVRLIEHLHQVIQSEYVARIRAQEARFLALQSQINPHFLHNTLQSMGTLALRDGNHEVYGATLALSRLLRYSLEDSHQAATLDEEIENGRQYTEIQKLRFGERLTVVWGPFDADLSIRVPRLVLQPLVENAVEHTLARTREAVLVTIRARREGEATVVEVGDNGPGIPADQLVELRGQLTGESPLDAGGTHIGLRNVAERLRLFFGADAVELDSRVGAGTVLRLRLPGGR